MISFPWLQSHLADLIGKAAIKLFAEIARSQASSIQAPCWTYLATTDRHKPDCFKADGVSLNDAFTLLDRFLSQLLLGKLTTEVRTVYLAQRASEATAHFKAHLGAYLPETLTSMLASLARLHFPIQAPIQVFKTGGGGTSFAGRAARKAPKKGSPPPS
jgi:hypothetical protein